jgi:hypothetical protein
MKIKENLMVFESFCSTNYLWIPGFEKVFKDF